MFQQSLNLYYTYLYHSQNLYIDKAGGKESLITLNSHRGVTVSHVRSLNTATFKDDTYYLYRALHLFFYLAENLSLEYQRQLEQW